MTDTPHDAASFVEWFTRTSIAYPDGSTAPREPLMTAENANRILAKLGSSFYRIDFLDVPDLFSVTIRDKLFHSSKYGWIDREGRFWRCGYCSHAFLLFFLNLTERDAELAGWVRVSQTVQCLFEITDEQFATMTRLGLTRDAESIMRRHAGQKPKRSAVKKARVK